MPTDPTPPVLPPHSGPMTVCPHCGGLLRFEPRSGRLRCTQCAGEQPRSRPSTQARAAAAAEAPLPGDWATRTEGETWTPALVSCHQCGAQTELPAHQVQAPCPFCATPLLLGDAERRRLIRPSGQLPFALDAPAARERLRAWLRGLWFAPNALRRLVRDTEALQGVYLPAWTFDARAVVRYQGERGDRREARAGDPAHSVQQGHVMDWRAVSGHFELRLDDELIPASHSLPALGEGALQGVNLSALEPCSEALSAGFIVEAYQVDLPDAWARVQQVWAPRVEAEVRRDIGGDEQRITAVDCEYREPHYRHVLLPAWLASYRWNGRSWPVVVNGQTGRVEGARPWSIWKLGFAALALLGLLLLGWAEGV